MSLNLSALDKANGAQFQQSPYFNNTPVFGTTTGATPCDTYESSTPSAPKSILPKLLLFGGAIAGGIYAFKTGKLTKLIDTVKTKLGIGKAVSDAVPVSSSAKSVESTAGELLKNPKAKKALIAGGASVGAVAATVGGLLLYGKHGSSGFAKNIRSVSKSASSTVGDFFQSALKIFKKTV